MPQDKIKHFVGGAIIGFVLGLPAAVAIGAAKEIVYDKLMKKGTPELLDFFATAIGGAAGAAFLQLLG